MQEQTIILLSCSNEKTQEGKRLHEIGDGRTFLSSEVLPTQSKRLRELRTQVFGLLKGKGGRLHNSDQGGGYRDERSPNRSLIPGPDFGAKDLGEAIYLPAWRRYKGRFFEAVGKDFWPDLSRSPVEVLFVSGLYGLLFWDERIQNYDCHFGDEIQGQVLKRTVANCWRPLLTDLLCEFVKARKKAGATIRDIFDLLSDELYQDVFDWKSVRENSDVKVHHRDFRPPSIGPDSLTSIAQVLNAYLRRFYQEDCLFRDGEWYSLNPTPGCKQKFRFEYPRVPERDKVLELLCLNHPLLRTLPREVCEQLSRAEISRLAAAHVCEFDVGTLIVSYTKCFELWLNAFVHGWRRKFRSPRETVRQLAEFRPLARDVNDLWDLRRPGAHAEPGADLERARSLTLKILSAASIIRRQPS